MTEIVFLEIIRKKQIKLVGYHIFFRLTFWCIGKLDVHQKYLLNQLLFIYIYIYIYLFAYIYIWPGPYGTRLTLD